MKDAAKRENYLFIFSEWNRKLPPPLRASAGPRLKEGARVLASIDVPSGTLKS